MKQPIPPIKPTPPMEYLPNRASVELPNGKHKIQDLLDQINVHDIKDVVLSVEDEFEDGYTATYVSLIFDDGTQRKNPNYERALARYQNQLRLYEQELVRYQQDQQKYEVYIRDQKEYKIKTLRQQLDQLENS